MSRRETTKDYIDDEYSSGDSNRAQSKCLDDNTKKAQDPRKCQEENNNEIDHLTQQLDEMGCIVDAVKRPPNICVEKCVHVEDSESETSEPKTVLNKEVDEEEDAYTDEFEEDRSDAEDKEDKKQVDNTGDTLTMVSGPQMALKTGSRASFINVPKPASDNSGSSYGSIPVPRTHRINMSFTNARLREIERQNRILLTKIVSARNNRKSSIPPCDREVRRSVPPAALLRRNDQKKIDYENMILLKKIQRAKSSSYSVRR